MTPLKPPRAVVGDLLPRQINCSKGAGDVRIRRLEMAG